MSRAPSSAIDLFSDETLEDPYPVYAELRSSGPVVQIEKNDLFAVTRYAQAREVLRNWEGFTSRFGTAFNQLRNASLAGESVVTSDPPEHDRLRALILRWLSPKRMRSLEASISAHADRTVGSLVSQGQFDLVADLAEVLPSIVVGELIGLPKEVRGHLLEWGDAGFNSSGPLNPRALAGFEVVQRHAQALVDLSRDEFEAGTVVHEILSEVEEGALDRSDAVRLLVNLTAPSIETTVSAIGTAIDQLARHPDQWSAVRERPNLIPAVANEALRYESPLQLFSRVTTAPQNIGGVDLPCGARVAVLFGSANRDDRKYDRAAAFDIARDASDHVAFGFGIHRCVGAPLARIEIHAAIRALTRAVERLEVGAPTRDIHNITRRLSGLPVAVVTS